MSTKNEARNAKALRTLAEREVGRKITLAEYRAWERGELPKPHASRCATCTELEGFGHLFGCTGTEYTGGRYIGSDPRFTGRVLPAGVR